jgi:hypothetical protein
LARVAARFDDAALSARNDATRREKLLAAFVRYTEAAERAATRERIRTRFPHFASPPALGALGKSCGSEDPTGAIHG